MGAVDHPEKPVFEYNYIDDGIYVGTNQCCEMHFKEELLKKRVRADISLEGERVDQPFGVDFYLWLPVKDHTPPSSKQMKLGVATLEKLVGMGEKIYVHCKNGHGRAPTLVAAYFIKTKGFSANEAIAFMKERRPSVHYWDAQVEALEDFFRKLKRKNTQS